MVLSRSAARLGSGPEPLLGGETVERAAAGQTLGFQSVRCFVVRQSDSRAVGQSDRYRQADACQEMRTAPVCDHQSPDPTAEQRLGPPEKGDIHTTG